MTAPPLAFQWDGEAMRPLRPKAADKQFAIGQIYWLIEEQLRSEASHRQYFGWMREAWTQLPEKLADEMASPEILRKRALIACGFFDERIIDAGTRATALRVAAFAGERDAAAVTIVRGPIVIVRTAKSQSRRMMRPKEFQESKTATMEWIASLIGVQADEIGRAAA